MDIEPRTGGKPVLTVVGQAERDLAPVVAGNGLTAAVERLGASTRVDTLLGSPGRVDHLLQRLTGGPVPEGLLRLGLPADFLEDQFSTPIAGPDLDVVILSAGSDLASTHWAGGSNGSIIRPPDGYADVWPAEVVIAFEREFDEVPLLSAEQYFDATREVIGLIKERSDVHVLLLGASTLGEPLLGSYAGVEDDHRLRAHRVNAAQVRLSMALGVSLVDVDRVVANLGGAGQVLAPLDYSDAVLTAICDEIAYVLHDIGFFENRPLVAQVGRGEGL